MPIFVLSFITMESLYHRLLDSTSHSILDTLHLTSVTQFQKMLESIRFVLLTTLEHVFLRLNSELYQRKASFSTRNVQKDWKKFASWKPSNPGRNLISQNRRRCNDPCSPNRCRTSTLYLKDKLLTLSVA